MQKYILEMKGITKTFLGVKALNNVNFSVQKGEVHALVGENGAGKSTLMKILNGVHSADSGKIFINGEEAKIRDIKDAQRYGLSLIFQELNLIQKLSVAENIYLGKLALNRSGFVDWKTIQKQADNLVKSLGFSINVNTIVEELSIAEKQMIEIAKALSINAKIIVMDEPTSSLTNKETEKLFAIIENLKNSNVTVIYISHKMDEIFKLCDKVTVLRDGEIIDTKSIGETNRDDIVTKMVGRPIDLEFPKRNIKPGEIIFEARNILRSKIIKDISFYLRKGEILGIAGLVGAGRTELAEIIFGAVKKDDGEIIIKGKKVLIHSTKDAVDNSIGMVTEDRKGTGLVLDFSVAQNITIANLKKICGNKSMINIRKENQYAEEFKESLNIKTPSINHNVADLSGGNQQKVALAKWLFADVDILILDEPTRGIDVKAKYEIYLLMNKLAEAGKSMIMISSELPELLGMCDRLLVIQNGFLRGELEDDNINAESVMHLAIGSGGNDK